MSDTNMLKNDRIEETQKRLAKSVFEYFKTKAEMISFRTVSNQVRLKNMTEEEKERLQTEEKQASRLRELQEKEASLALAKFKKGVNVMKSISRLRRRNKGWVDSLPETELLSGAKNKK